MNRTHDGACAALPRGPLERFEPDSSASAERDRVESVTPEAVFALVHVQMQKLAGHREVDDLVQTAALHAIRSLPGFQGRSRLSTWTFRICYLTIKKHDRWYRRWLRRFTLTDDGELPQFSAEPHAGDATEGDERLLREERFARLRAALAGLSEKRRSVVILHDLEGLSVDEVAEIVGVTPVAVRSRLRDGRNALAAALAGLRNVGGEENE